MNALSGYKSALALSMILVLCGCTGLLPRSRYTRPEVDLPRQWHEPVVTGTSVAAGDPWWQDYNDPVLSGLIEKALTSNNDLAAATIRVKRARLAARLTGTNLTPSVSVEASGSVSRDLKNHTDTRTSGVTAAASYELDLWGKLAGARDADRWEAEATEYDRKSTALTLIGTVAANYWTLAYLNERIASVEAGIADAEKILTVVTVKYKAGAVSTLDHVQALQTVASRKAQLTVLLQQRAESRNALAILFGTAPENRVPERQRLPDSSPPDVKAGIPADLLSRRPDLQAAEQRLKKYLTNVDTTRAGFYPSLTLTGTLGTSSTSLADILKNPFAALGAGVTLPFLQWNTMTLKVAISRTEYEEAVVNFRQTLYSALCDVENALAARRNVAEEIEQLEDSLALARKVDWLSGVRYREGSADLKSWLDAQESRRDAEKSLADVRLNQYKNSMTLYQVFGGTLQLKN
jgi:NodT family efflux transporter outer membrane factor (OMF) lipoprotein